MASDIHRTIEAVWRIEAARLIAGLARIVRDVGVAEDLAQDVLVIVLERWPERGIPNNPGAWLMATAKHRALDRLRRSSWRWYAPEHADDLADAAITPAPQRPHGPGPIAHAAAQRRLGARRAARHRHRTGPRRLRRPRHRLRLGHAHYQGKGHDLHITSHIWKFAPAPRCRSPARTAPRTGWRRLGGHRRYQPQGSRSLVNLPASGSSASDAVAPWHLMPAAAAPQSVSGPGAAPTGLCLLYLSKALLLLTLVGPPARIDHLLKERILKLPLCRLRVC
jgi:DNA-directed RNA polymerase specialized sigma24 family protein